MISKQIRKRGNQKLSEPLRTATALDAQGVSQAIQNLCDAHNAEKARLHAEGREQMKSGNRMQRWLANNSSEAVKPDYYVSVRDHDILVGWHGIPERILQIGKPSRADDYWLASVEFHETGASPELPTGPYVELKLLMWVTDHEGRLSNKDKYEAFSDAVWTAVSTNAAA